MWLVAGGVVGRLLASPETTALLAAQKDDQQRGKSAALLMRCAGTSPHHVERVRYNETGSALRGPELGDGDALCQECPGW